MKHKKKKITVKYPDDRKIVVEPYEIAVGTPGVESDSAGYSVTYYDKTGLLHTEENAMTMDELVERFREILEDKDDPNRKVV